MTNRPFLKVRFGGLAVTVWRNDNDKFSCSVEKRYLDKETDEWKSSKSFFPNDLPILANLLNEAFRRIAITAKQDDE